METEIFPPDVKKAIENIDTDKIYEMRFRLSQPIKLNYANKKVYLSFSGISLFENKALICSENHIRYIIENVTENSIYAFNESIKKGYLTTKSGIRIGLAGECVFDENIITIKNFSSLNIRIPHEIYGCSDEIFKKIYLNDDILSTLILSPPFKGKTTILKDLCRKIDVKSDKSILIIDERCEFRSVSGKNIDKIENSNKLYAFNFSLRSMSPEIIITDELSEKSDFLCALSAVNSGVKIIASCHAGKIKDLLSKDYFIDGIFDRYVILSGESDFGKVKEIYDRDLKKI